MGLTAGVSPDYIRKHLKRAKEQGRDPVEYLKTRFGHTEAEAKQIIVLLQIIEKYGKIQS